MKRERPDYDLGRSNKFNPPKEMDSQGNIVDKKPRPKYDKNGLPMRRVRVIR
jgi:hypothetical protein